MTRTGDWSGVGAGGSVRPPPKVGRVSRPARHSAVSGEPDAQAPAARRPVPAFRAPSSAPVPPPYWRSHPPACRSQSPIVRPSPTREAPGPSRQPCPPGMAPTRSPRPSSTYPSDLTLKKAYPEPP